MGTIKITRKCTTDIEIPKLSKQDKEMIRDVAKGYIGYNRSRRRVTINEMKEKNIWGLNKTG